MIQLLHLFYFCGGGGNDIYTHLLEPVYLNVYIKTIKKNKMQKKCLSSKGEKNINSFQSDSLDRMNHGF